MGVDVSISSLKKYGASGFEAVAYNEAFSLTVENYDDTTITTTDILIADKYEFIPNGDLYEAKFTIDSAAGYWYTFYKDGVALESGVVLSQVDSDGAVDSSKDIVFSRTFPSKGEYELVVEAINPNSTSDALTWNQLIEEEPEGPTMPPVTPVGGVGNMTPGGGRTSPDPEVVGTAASPTASLEVNFGWASTAGAVEYGISLLDKDHNVICHQITGTATTFTKTLPVGKYFWYVIAWNSEGYSSWSEVAWFQVSSPDVSVSSNVVNTDIGTFTTAALQIQADGFAVMTLNGTLAVDETLEYFIVSCDSTTKAPDYKYIKQGVTTSLPVTALSGIVDGTFYKVYARAIGVDGTETEWKEILPFAATSL